MEIGLLWAAVALLGVLIIGSAVVLVQLVKQQGRLLLRLEALESPGAADALQVHRSGGGQPAPPSGRDVGSAVEPFLLATADGETLSLDDLRGRDALLVHWHPQCGYCRQIAPELAGIEPKLRDRGTELVLLSYGDPEVNRALTGEYGLRARICLQEEGQPIPAFEGLGTPVAYLLDGDGSIAAPLAFGALDVPELARAAAVGRRRLPSERRLGESRLLRTGLPPATVAPPFTLPTIDGTQVALADFRGRRTLLVFSDPDCGPCNELAPQLGEFYREHGDDLAIVMVSRGGVDENRRKAFEHRLEFPVAIQPGRRVAKDYGIFATPVAFLIDEEGVIARDVAEGTPEVLGLARDAVAREEARL